YFLAIGPTYPHKNFEFLIETYNELNSEIKKSHRLLIVGGLKGYLGEIKRLVNELNLENNVKFLGYVPAEELPSLYQNAECLIFPSLYEGFGFPLVEAMACGCPVLASNTSSMPEICGDAAIYFDPTNKQSLKKAIEEIIGNEKTKKDLIKK